MSGGTPGPAGRSPARGADGHVSTEPMPVTATGESDCAKVTVVAPAGTAPEVVREMAERYAANPQLLLDAKGRLG